MHAHATTCVSGCRWLSLWPVTPWVSSAGGQPARTLPGRQWLCANELCRLLSRFGARVAGGKFETVTVMLSVGVRPL